MKIRKRRAGGDERRVLIGMITDAGVLGRVASRWKDNGLFKNRWSNLIAGWAVDFYREYGDAPNGAIEALFDEWLQSPAVHEDSAKLIEDFLAKLSGEYERHAEGSNTQHLITLAGKVINQNYVDILVRKVQDSPTKKALAMLDAFTPMQLGDGATVDVFNDEEAWKDAIDSERNSIVRYPGALGNFFGDDLGRDEFIAFMGPEKRGKTWWLIDLCMRACEQGRKVAFFEVGDMSQRQILRRLATRITGVPFKSKPFRLPTRIELEPEAEVATVRLAREQTLAPLKWKQARKKVRKYGKKRDLRLVVHPNSSISVNGIRSQLQTWEREGWCPDVVIVDYADILAPINGTGDTRDQINATWKGLRRISQEFHCLMATATQADAQSYGATTLTTQNFSEDKRKFAHVTGMCGLNQTIEEKAMGITRLNWLVLREAEFELSTCCHVAGCLSIGQPAMFSTF